MPRSIKTIHDLQNYLSGVLERADHHAGPVKEASIILAGLIVLYKDPESTIEVKEYAGNTANIMWVMIGGERYAFRYEHKTQRIEMCENSYKGRCILEIDNNTSIDRLRKMLDKLRAGSTPE